MTQESRLKRLETALGGKQTTILAVVPNHWGEDEVAEGITRLRQKYALPADSEVDLMRDRTCAEERLLFAGDLGALFDHVAKNSAKVGIVKSEDQE
tara:strand:- start:365 stop:652 length:288 start_codon:yes stop_codon:yes gene_type:complete